MKSRGLCPREPELPRSHQRLGKYLCKFSEAIPQERSRCQAKGNTDKHHPIELDHAPQQKGKSSRRVWRVSNASLKSTPQNSMKCPASVVLGDDHTFHRVSFEGCRYCRRSSSKSAASHSRKNHSFAQLSAPDCAIYQYVDNQTHFLRQVFLEFDDHSQPGRFRIILQELHKIKVVCGLLLCLAEPLVVSALIQWDKYVRSQLYHTSLILPLQPQPHRLQRRRPTDV